MSTGSGPLLGTAEQIAERIRDEIEGGAMVPGQALSQADLAKSFGLSRIPIREALRVLQAEGYVTYRPNRGMSVVASPSLEDIAEIIEIREALESRIMERAAVQIGAGTIRAARTALRALNAARSPAELRGAHQRFHTILFEAGGRPHMSALVNAWRFRLDGRPDSDGSKRRAFAAAVADIHERVLNACAHHDAHAAMRCVTEEYDYLRSIAPMIHGA